MKALVLLAAVSTAAFTILTTGPDDKKGLPEPVVDADYYNDGAPSAAQVDLGRLLFFDKIVSGNQNISCASCHHPDLATTDGIALPLGEGPMGLGPDRHTAAENAVQSRVGRNTPALFNLGAKEFSVMFHDGRVEADPHGYYEGGFITPAKWKLPKGIENPLAAQAMFPPTSPDEMAGHKGENTVAEARSLNNAAGPGGVWEQLSGRIASIPEYLEMFKAAYPEEVEAAEDVSFVMVANAISTFEAKAFRSDNSPFDQYLRGEAELSAEAARGMELFYGKAACDNCHSGKFQTDHSFHAIAMPQIGPGKADGNDPDYWRETGLQAFLEDFGRGRVTVRSEDRYKFRTPSLRNVELTGPYGHDGAYATLEGIVRHHVDPVAALNSYKLPPDLLPPIDDVVETTADGPRLVKNRLEGQRLEGFLQRDTWVQQNPKLRAKIAEANELAGVVLTDDEVSDVLTFLHALTDPSARDLSHDVPETVPSGLPVVD